VIEILPYKASGTSGRGDRIDKSSGHNTQKYSTLTFENTPEAELCLSVSLSLLPLILFP
jgi:hypothetical protein